MVLLITHLKLRITATAMNPSTYHVNVAIRVKNTFVTTQNCCQNTTMLPNAAHQENGKNFLT